MVASSIVITFSVTVIIVISSYNVKQGGACVGALKAEAPACLMRNLPEAHSTVLLKLSIVPPVEYPQAGAAPGCAA